MNIELSLKITNYLDDGLPSMSNGVYKNEIKVYPVSSVSDIVSNIKSYFSEVTVEKDISFNGSSLSVTEETTADTKVDEESVQEYFEEGLKAIANKHTKVVKLGFDAEGNIVPQFGGRPKYVAALYATITE